MAGRWRFPCARAERTLYLSVICLVVGLVVAATAGVGSTQADPGGLQSRPLGAPRATAPRIPSQLAAAGAVEVIAVLAEGADTSGLSNAATAAGAKLERVQDAATGAVPFAVFSSTTLNRDELMASVQALAGVVSVSPNYRRALYGVPDDTYFAELWGLENTGQVPGTTDADIDASTAWDTTTGSGAVVAVIDTGVDYTHEDLAANMWTNVAEAGGTTGVDDDANGYIDDIYGIDACADDVDPMDDDGSGTPDGHGTHLAGIVAAVGNNTLGVAGVAYGALVMALRAADSSGLTDADAIECIDYAIDMKLNHGVNVVAIDASWGGGGFDQALIDAIDAAGAAGIVFVAAAGNEGANIDSTPYYPASYDCPSMIVVGASDSYDQPVGFSNYGATKVDLFAPGLDILSAYPQEEAFYWPNLGDNAFFDDVESGVGGWTAAGTNNTWAITEEASLSPTHSWTDSPGTDYTDNTDSSLTTATLDLSAYASSGAYLDLGAFVTTEEINDYLDIDVSGDAGASWTNVDRLTGDLGSCWYYGALPTAVLTTQFQLRVHLVTNDSVTADGVYIDDVGIGAPVAYDYLSGTSAAAPHVAGAVALLAANAPSETPGAWIARLLASVDTPAGLSGKCLSDGRLNVVTALSTSVPAPTVTGLDPAVGPRSGGTSVVITGAGFYEVSAVTFGGTAAAGFRVDSPTQITATSPGGWGTVQVQVTAAGGASADTGADDFTFEAPTGNYIERVSVSESEAQSNGDNYLPRISADGRYVAFHSYATDLVSGDNNGWADVFVRDRGTGTTERVSVSDGEAQASGGDSYYASISADGRYVAFRSSATNLVAGDTNGCADIFVRDRLAGTTERVSVGHSGAQSNGENNLPAISADGRYVAFHSYATNLVAEEDTNGAIDVFVRDRVAGTTERVSVTGDEGQGSGGDSREASISADGRYVAFRSAATNLVANDDNGLQDIFVRDRTAGTTERVSVSDGEAQASGGDSYYASINADGRYVAFHSHATNLVDGDTNGFGDIFVRDRTAGTTERVSLSGTGAQSSGGYSYDPAINADGRYVAFYSSATNLVAGDTNGSADIFVRDRTAATTERVSLSGTGAQSSGGYSYDPAISADGRHVAFWGGAADLVPDDTNGKNDVFVVSLSWTTSITGISPGAVSVGGESSVTISGWHFSGVTGVTFGGVPASSYAVVESSTRMTAIAPAHASGSVLVQVSGTYGTSPDGAAAYVIYLPPPTITGLTPSTGPRSGGTSVVISGTGFYEVSAVTFGGTDALDFTADSPTQITATSPGGWGTVQVQVTTAVGPSADTSADDYAYEGAPNGTERVSVSSEGSQYTGTGSDSSEVSISADGRYVAFSSSANSLVSGDTNACYDIFVRDRQTGSTERVSVRAIDGAQANAASSDPAISADGRYVAFASAANNLVVTGDGNSETDIFVRDRQTGVTTLVSVRTDGAQADGGSSNPAISADGRYVAFESDATNLDMALADTNEKRDIYVRDLAGGLTERVSLDSSEAQATGGSNGSFSPSISADGIYVAFDSDMTNLVSKDTNGDFDVFVRDRANGLIERVSVDSNEVQAQSTTDGSRAPSLSSDGRYVAFESYAANLVTGDTNGDYDVFVRDREGGITERVSVNTQGQQGTPIYYCGSRISSISADGRFVAFMSQASNLVGEDTNSCRDVFVYDRAVGACFRLSVDGNETQGNAESGYSSSFGTETVALSADGHSVAFRSLATNLVPGDTNARPDMFVVSREWVTRVSSVSPAVVSAAGTTSVIIGGLGFRERHWCDVWRHAGCRLFGAVNDQHRRHGTSSRCR